MSPLQDRTYLSYPAFNIHLTVPPDTMSSTQGHIPLHSQHSENDSSAWSSKIVCVEGSDLPSTIFPFMSLAGELRNQIYAESLASGTITLLLLSKETYVEAKPLLYKVGILKLGKDGLYFGRKFEHPTTRTWRIPPVPSEDDLPLIQNVTFDIAFNPLYSAYLNDTRLFWDSWAPHGRPQPAQSAHVRERGIMAPFMNTASIATRDTCQVILRGFDMGKRGTILMTLVLHVLRYFDNFKKVIVIIAVDHTGEAWFYRARRYCEKQLQGYLSEYAWHPDFEAFDDGSHSDGYLEFHPRRKDINSVGTLTTM